MGPPYRCVVVRGCRLREVGVCGGVGHTCIDTEFLLLEKYICGAEGLGLGGYNFLSLSSHPYEPEGLSKAVTQGIMTGHDPGCFGADHGMVPVRVLFLLTCATYPWQIEGESQAEADQRVEFAMREVGFRIAAREAVSHDEAPSPAVERKRALRRSSN
eukprot:CAMPEP_0174914928 /NCGR_PEP_ID=MMETSP0167-20121228/81095_1 /TAXON_ID=38298 /ORGANISM="Rhodella maculata, Strain CCMP736" /LENGTH=157 /DNA_ID=CAMNT_0016159709 /DNA_START=713 /DNA_END=1188 /DNA_ORIENTATION=-